MKTTLVLFSLILMNFGCKNISKEEVNDQNHKIEEVNSKTKKILSPHSYAMAMVDDVHIHIDYSSPSVRGRIIFGGLVAYDEVWQSGAHKATWLETDKDLLVNSKLLKAGKYGFFTIPNKDNWTVILNKNWDQHGKDKYDERDDVLRFNVKPEISEEITEQLVYNVQKINESEGSISLSWEKITLSFSFSIPK